MITIIIGILFLIQTEYTAIGVLFIIKGVCELFASILKLLSNNKK